MHELSIAVSLVEEVGRILKYENASRATRVVVAIGALSGIEREPLEACFPLAAEGTPVEDAALAIEELPVEVMCGACHNRTRPQWPLLSCKDCASSNVQIVQGQELIIRSLEVE
jgi:hydrogenase nickel incorporation protein HypA/HybF